MRESEFLKASSRPAQTLAGAVLGLLALPFFLLGVFGAYHSLPKASSDPTPLALFTALGAFGGMCLFPAWRLVSGRRRRDDGGLLPPSALRVGGVFFVAAPIVILFKLPWAFLEAAGLVGAGFACFALARHRERRSGSPPGIVR